MSLSVASLCSDVPSAAIIALSLASDAFVSAFAFGGSGIKMPMKSIHVINIVGSVILIASLTVGVLANGIVPPSVTGAAGFAVLFALGIVKLLNGVSKALIKRFGGMNGEVNVRLFDFRLILRVYADPTTADTDRSKVISPREAASLAVALSLDCIAAGFGASLGGVNPILVVVFTLIANYTALIVGMRLGTKTSLKTDISWLGGALLIMLAIMRL